MTRSSLVSVGAALLAFLASQHHNLHMLLVTFGLGGAGMTFIQAYPSVRRAMLLISLGMVVVNLRTLRRPRMTVALRWLTLAFTVLTLGLVAYSIASFGW
jgi:hypothetical protein